MRLGPVSSRSHHLSAISAQTTHSTPVKTSESRSGLVLLDDDGSSQMSEWTSLTAFAPE